MTAIALKPAAALFVIAVCRKVRGKAGHAPRLFRGLTESEPNV